MSSMLNSSALYTISVRRSSPYFSLISSSSFLMISSLKLLALQNGLQLLDQLDDLAVLVLDLLPLQAGEPLEPHVEDRLRLDLRELELLHQPVPGRFDVLRRLDQLDDRVDVVERDDVALEDVRAFLRLVQLELRPPHNHLVPVLDEVSASSPSASGPAAARPPAPA